MAKKSLFLKPFDEIPDIAKYSVGEYIHVIHNELSKNFFTHIDYLEAKVYRQKCLYPEAVAHYTQLVTGCFEILDVVHGSWDDTDFGVFYRILDEHGQIEYIPQCMAEFRY